MAIPNKNFSRFSRCLWLTWAMFVVVAATFSFYVYSEKQIDLAHELRLRSFLLADELRQSSDDLTRMVRTYVITGDPLYKRHYLEILDIRDGKKPRPVDYANIYWDLVLHDDKRPRPSGPAAPLLELMRQANFTETELARLAEAKANSDALTRTEFNAMALVESTTPPTEANRIKASNILQDNDYHRAKLHIMLPISEFYQMMTRRTLAAVHTTEKQALLVRVTLILFSFLLMYTLYLAYRSLHATLGCSVDELQKRIVQLGSGDFSAPPIPKDVKNSVLNWLSETQANLANIEAARKQAEEALKQSEERFKTMFNEAPMGIALIDSLNGKIYEVNPMFAKILGRSLEQIAHIDWMSITHPDDVQEDIDNMALLNAGKISGFQMEKRYLHLDGTTVWINMTIAPLKTADKSSPRHLCMIEDISQRKHSESELERFKGHLEEEVQLRTADLILARNAAEAANRAKSVFLSSMSHELRTPLNAILGFSSLLRQNPKLSAEQCENLDIINHSGEHLLSLINDVLEMAKIEANHVQLENQAFDLGALVREVTDMIHMRAQEKGLQLLIDQSSKFPRYFKGDETRLRQVLINLVSNAVKFTPQGSITIHLNVKHNATLPRLLIAVEDCGIGIKPEDQKKIFEPFEQAGESGAQTGTGLGLTLSRQYVELMGGTISLESTPGQGSIFTLELPFEPVSSDDVTVLQSATSGEIVSLAQGQPEYRILIVEDQIENRLLLSKLMKNVGFSTRLAQNGEEAVELFQSWQPHFIWMDRRMPVMDGIEATRRIRALPGGKDVKIVAVTASAFMDQRDEMFTAGIDDFIHKPYRAHEIYDCLAKYLGVQYLYKNEQVTEQDWLLTPDMLSALPVEWRQALQEALLSLDSECITAVIKQAATYDRHVHTVLSHLADGFDYPAILSALQNQCG